MDVDIPTLLPQLLMNTVPVTMMRYYRWPDDDLEREFEAAGLLAVFTQIWKNNRWTLEKPGSHENTRYVIYWIRHFLYWSSQETFGRLDSIHRWICHELLRAWGNAQTDCAELAVKTPSSRHSMVSDALNVMTHSFCNECIVHIHSSSSLPLLSGDILSDYLLRYLIDLSILIIRTSFLPHPDPSVMY